MTTAHPVMADSRDMFVIHDMFRREFAAIPELVGLVSDGDHDHTAVVADHVTWMVAFLHKHHEGEDELVWPKLLERAPEATAPLIHTMESQHLGLAQALDALGVTAEAWRATSAAAERDALSRAGADLLPVIAEHLALEEREVLPLIDGYLTEKEWKQVGGSGMKKMTFAQIKIAFGMILHTASPEQVQIMRDTIPRVPWAIFSLVGPRAYDRYAERLHSATVDQREFAA